MLENAVCCYAHTFLTPQNVYIQTLQFLLRKRVNSKPYFHLPEGISRRLLEV
jgi:hypothetical protein